MYYKRTLQDSWSQALLGQSPILLLTGPRQAGKTTLLQRLAGKARRHVNLDDPSLRELASQDPALLLQRFQPPVLIEQIQYAPQLLPAIEKAIDADRRPGMFWLTASRQFSTLKGPWDTLAGQLATFDLLGFSSRERHRQYLDLPPFLPTRETIRQRQASAAPSDLNGVYKDIWLGSFPSLTAGPVKDRDAFYSAYLQNFLQRDLRGLVQVADESAFLRFLRACAARTATMLNLTDLARDADVAVNTAKNWLAILHATFQVYLLPPFAADTGRRLVKAPKLYFLDTGLCAYLTEWPSPQTLAAGAMSAAILETHVLSELLKSWLHRGRTPQLFYYRDRNGAEIDFLFEQDWALYPIDVKKTATARPDLARPFKALTRLRRPVAEGAVLCLCEDVTPLAHNIDAVPVGII